MIDESTTERTETNGEMELPSEPKSASKCLWGEGGDISFNSPHLNNRRETGLKILTWDFKMRLSFRKGTLKSVKEDSIRAKMDKIKNETREANVNTECQQTELPAKCKEDEEKKCFQEDSPPVDNQVNNEPQTLRRGLKIIPSFRNGTSFKVKSAEGIGFTRSNSKRFSMGLFKRKEDGDQASKENESIPGEDKPFGREGVQNEPLSDSIRAKMDKIKNETREAIVKTECLQTELPAKCKEDEEKKCFQEDSPPVDNQVDNEPQTLRRGLKIIPSFRNGTSFKVKSAEGIGFTRSNSKRFSMGLFKWKEDGDQASKENESIPEEDKPFGREGVQNEPLSVMQINDLIQKRQLLEAFKHIWDLEGELLAEREAKKYEDHPKEYTVRAKDVDLLYESLSKEIQHIVEDTLDLSSTDAKVLIEMVVALIEEEEKVHAGAAAITVPSEPVSKLGLARNWREHWKKTVNESVNKRILKVHMPLKDDATWLLTHLGYLKNAVRQDLLTIKDSMHQFYPDNYRVCDTYLKAFHEALSLHLQGILQAGNSFESHEFHAILDWVTNVYHSEGLLGHPDLQPEIKTEDLPSLLTPEVLDKLEKDYIHSVKLKTKSCLENIQILEAKGKWDSEEQPEALQSQYHSSLSFDIQTIVGEHMKASGKICKNLEAAVLEMSVKEVTRFIPCFGKAFLEQDKEKNYPQFASLMVTYVNNFYDLRMEFRTRFNVNCEELEKTLDDLIVRYRKYFLNKLMLKTQLIFKKILSQAWIINSRTLDSFIMKILLVIEDFSQHLNHLKEPILKEFLNEVHKFVVKEYITQVLKTKSRMKRTKRELVSRIMTQEATTINDTMMHLGSNAEWLFPAIPDIASIISEKEKGKIKYYLERLAWNYPDIREEHMMAILTLRGLKQTKRQSIARHVNRPSVELEFTSGRTLFAEIEFPNTIRCFSSFCR